MPAARPTTSPRLLASIEAALATLSPNDRRIADHLLATYPTATWETVEELARSVGVSKSAVVRFAVRLGYDGFTELQQELRAEFAELLASPVSLLERRPPEAKPDLVDALFEQTVENLERTRARAAPQLLDAGRRIADRKGDVHVLGLQKSTPYAVYAHYLLSQVRADVRLVRAASATFPEELMDVGGRDVVLAITVRRYSKLTLTAMELCRAAGAYVVAISDTLAGPATPRADTTLVAVSDGVSHIDSAASVVFLVEALVNAVVGHRPRAAGRRLERVEDVRRTFAHVGTERLSRRSEDEDCGD